MRYFTFIAVSFFIMISSSLNPVRADGDVIDLSDVGQVALNNSGTPAAQQSFLHGLAQLHNFEYEFAAVDFVKAQQIDPDFALAYWGEAMTHNHAIWQGQDKEKALAALNKYAPTPAARQAKAPTELARNLFAAVDILYGVGSKQDNDDLYLIMMRGLYKKYPDNVEIASFTALSIMGSAHEGRDIALYMQSAAIMEDFIDAYPRHPGVAHYLIHSTDDSTHAPLGLRAARAYGSIAPNAAHPQHMTTHIFLALGMWEDVIRANVRAVEIVNAENALEGKKTIGCGHYPSWLMYGYLQNGQRDEATAIMNRCHEIVLNEGSEIVGTLNSYSWMRALYLLDAEDWLGPVAGMAANLGISPRAVFYNEYLTTVIALNTGKIAGAKLAYERTSVASEALSKQWDKDGVPADHPYRQTPVVQLMQLRAQIKIAEGDSDGGIILLREAVELEHTLPIRFGPPRPSKPSIELLGETLIKLGYFKEARDALTISLARTQGKAASIAAMKVALEELAQ